MRVDGRGRAAGELEGGLGEVLEAAGRTEAGPTGRAAVRDMCAVCIAWISPAVRRRIGGVWI